MKQHRRQELKTNELSIYLGQMYDFLVRNSTYVVGGVVVVALIIIVGTMNVRSQHQAKVDAMNRIRAIQSGEAAQDLKLLDEIKDFIGEYGDDPWLGPSLLDLQASLAHHLALGRTSEADKAEHDRLLDEAKSACERAIQRFGSRPLVVARAKLSLAAIEETLFVEGKGEQGRIRKLYQEVIDGPVSPYRKLASEQLSSLDTRLAKLAIVATRPAASAPASASPFAMPPIALPTAPATTTRTAAAAASKPAE